MRGRPIARAEAKKLHAEWRGSAPQVFAAKAQKYQDPQRCLSMQQLWEALPSWEQLESEGYAVVEWGKAQALDKLVPHEQLQQASSRILWAETTPKWDRDGDVHMGAVLQDASSRAANAQEPSLVWHLQGQCAKFAAGADWDGVNVLKGVKCRRAKAKEKGTAKEDCTAKGASSKSIGKGGDGLDGHGLPLWSLWSPTGSVLSTWTWTG